MLKFITRFFALLGFLVVLGGIGIIIAVQYPTVKLKSIAPNSILQINFDYPVEFEYNCPQCGAKLEEK